MNSSSNDQRVPPFLPRNQFGKPDLQASVAERIKEETKDHTIRLLREQIEEVNARVNLLIGQLRSYELRESKELRTLIEFISASGLELSEPVREIVAEYTEHVLAHAKPLPDVTL